MEIFFREKYLERIRGFYDEDDLIKVITGVRRCGKSCLMQMIAAELRARGVSENNILFLDLDKRGFRQVREAAQGDSGRSERPRSWNRSSTKCPGDAAPG